MVVVADVPPPPRVVTPPVVVVVPVAPVPVPLMVADSRVVEVVVVLVSVEPQEVSRIAERAIAGARMVSFFIFEFAVPPQFGTELLVSRMRSQVFPG